MDDTDLYRQAWMRKSIMSWRNTASSVTGRRTYTFIPIISPIYCDFLRFNIQRRVIIAEDKTVNHEAEKIIRQSKPV